MQPRVRLLLRTLVGVVASGLACAGSPSPAAAETVFGGAGDTITTYSDRGEYPLSDRDFIGQGEPYLWRGTNAAIEVEGYPEELTVRALGGPAGKRMSASFAAPAGQPLERGVYADASYPLSRRPDQSGIQVSKESNGCQPTGRFEIRDIARDARGEITRLWLLFEQSCSIDVPAFWGEIRLGESDTPDGPRLSPTVIRWPAEDFGAPRTAVPVFFTGGPSGSRVARVEVDGPNAADVSIADDQCTGRALPAAAECRVTVRFAPRAAGTREAAVTLVDGTGARRTTAIQGWSYGGTTDFRVEGPSGEWVTRGTSSEATPATGRVTVGGLRPYPNAYLQGPGGSYRLDLSPAPGDVLQAGRTYAPTARYPFNGSLPGLTLGSSNGCNTTTGSFTVDDITWRPDGVARSLSVRFEQRCEASELVARGRVRHRVGDTTPPAPWMRSTTTSPPEPDPDPAPPVAPEPTTTEASPLLPSVATESGGETAMASTGGPAAATGGRPAAVARRAPRLVFRGLRGGGRSLRYTVDVPARGSATVEPWIRVGGRTVRLGRRSTTATRPGARTVTVTIPRSARAAIRRTGRGTRLSTRLTWRAPGAAPVTSRTVVPLR